MRLKSDCGPRPGYRAIGGGLVFGGGEERTKYFSKETKQKAIARLSRSRQRRTPVKRFWFFFQRRTACFLFRAATASAASPTPLTPRSILKANCCEDGL
jgi:hypothetical protein